jgi:lysophospholipase L1-like esterase
MKPVPKVRTVRLVCAALLIFMTTSLNDAAAFRIMPLGDSITGGVSSAECYRLYLDRLLTAAYYSFDFVGTLTGHRWDYLPADSVFDVDHEGHWGMDAHIMRANAGGYARAKMPDMVLLHIGTNDILHEKDTAQSIDAMLGRTANEIGGIIDTLRKVNPNIVIFVAKLILDASRTDTPMIAKLNTLIPPMVAARNTAQSPLIVVDQWSGLSMGDLVDNWHPNQNGAKKMANKWYAALAPVLNQSGAVCRPKAPRTAAAHASRILLLGARSRLGWTACTYDIAGKKTLFAPAAAANSGMPALFPAIAAGEN